MTRVLVLHAYSANNRGDGLLVEEAVALASEALGRTPELVMIARDPGSFPSFPGTVLTAPPSPRFLVDLPRILLALTSADLIVGVGGGYARGHSGSQLLKFLIGHSWQMLIAYCRRRHVVYLPQSVGPFPRFFLPLLRAFYKGIAYAAVRDDRSMSELHLTPANRLPDCAILSLDPSQRESAVQPAGPIIVSVRQHTENAHALYRQLVRQIGVFDGYVQSATLGNDDTAIMASLEPQRTVSASEMLCEPIRKRVLIAVRLHAALMALQSGHYVVHLAYERKGFGAFQDLGLEAYCHVADAFDVQRVTQQAEDLLSSESHRRAYDAALTKAAARARLSKQELLQQLAKALTRGD